MHYNNVLHLRLAVKRENNEVIRNYLSVQVFHLKKYHLLETLN